MVSDLGAKMNKQKLAGVLIFVLMEYVLWLTGTLDSKAPEVVLSLFLIEYVLWLDIAIRGNREA